MNLADRFIARMTRRLPDFVIVGPQRPYLRRWWAGRAAAAGAGFGAAGCRRE